MSMPVLIAETPRMWGQCKHRFLAPPDSQVNDKTAGAFVDAVHGPADQAGCVDRNPSGARSGSLPKIPCLSWGDNFVGLWQLVGQPLSGREGPEVLVMAGIDVSRLSGAEKHGIQSFLEKRLPDLERIVSQDGGHGTEETTVVIPRRELADWLRQDFPNGLPLHAQRERPVLTDRPVPLPMAPTADSPQADIQQLAGKASMVRKRMVVLMAGMTLGAIVLGGLLSQKNKPPQTGRRTEPTNPRPPVPPRLPIEWENLSPEKKKAIYDKFLESLNCKSRAEEARQQLFSAAKMTKPYEITETHLFDADTLEEEKFLQIKQIGRLIMLVQNDKKIDPYFFLPKTPSDAVPDPEDYFLTWPYSAGEARRDERNKRVVLLRKHLADIDKAFQKLKKELEGCELPNEAETPFLGMLFILKTSTAYQPRDKAFKEDPILPFFDERDRALIQDLKRFFSSEAANKAFEKIPGISRDRTFPSLVTTISKCYEGNDDVNDIVLAVEGERGGFLHGKELNIKITRNGLYGKLKDFFAILGKSEIRKLSEEGPRRGKEGSSKNRVP